MNNSGQKYEWFRDWFDSPYYHLLYFHRDNIEARNFLDALLDDLKPGKEAHLLDLACGKGRHSIYLNSLGYRVTGLDLSPRNIEEAKQHTRPGLEFFTHDMRNPLPETYSHILNLFTSFGYFSTRAEHIAALKNIHNGLEEGGVFVLDYLNAVYVTQHLVTHNREHIEGVRFDMIRRVNGVFIEKDIQINDGDITRFFQEKVRTFKESELRELLRETGFQVIEVWGDYALSPFDGESSPRMILKCQKQN